MKQQIEQLLEEWHPNEIGRLVGLSDSEAKKIVREIYFDWGYNALADWAPSYEEGTGFVGAKLAGTPSPGNPVSGNDNSTVIPGYSTGNMTAAGLKYLGGSPLSGYAKGGQVEHIPEFITGKTGNYVQGAGDGQSDSIPAMLADGEYVFDADTVAALGNGSNKAGALVLDKMRESIREHKRSAPVGKIPPKAKSPLSYLKGMK
jgi:hypothetical protein